MLKLRSALARKGYRLYQKRLKAELEPAHVGEFVAIDVESGEYFLGADMDAAIEKAESKYPDREFFVLKVGDLATASFKHHYSI